MTIGVIWEFVEFTFDQFFYLDMQKDFIVKNIASVTLDPTHSQIPVKVSDITRTIIETKSGKEYIIDGGYLDIGIIDTMKDLMVNFVGAIVFSVIGYFGVKYRDRRSRVNKIADDLIVRTLSDDEMLEQQQIIEAKQAERKKDHK